MSESQASSFDAMLAAGSRIVPFTGLEEFKLKLWIGPINELESAEYEASHWKLGTTDISPQNLKQSRRKLLALTVCDEHGKRLLTEAQAGQLDSRLAGMLYDQAEKHVKPDKPKNLPAAKEGDSPSDSRPNVDAQTSTSSSAN